jgi:transcriptional regulator with XRE-family HTH domain
LKSQDFVRHVVAQLGALGLTQQDLAEAANIDRTQISRWLHGRRGMSMRSMERLERAFHSLTITQTGE